MTELEVAIEAAEAAAVLLAQRGDGPTRVRSKDTAVDLVTEVDAACERVVREVLARHTPDVPVLGEELGGSAADTRWVVDPLDGTVNFVHGFPFYAVSVALEVEGVLQVGAIVDPLRQRTYSARRGSGAHCNGVRLAVSDQRDLGAALAATGFPYDRRERAGVYLAYVDAVLRTTTGLRRAGAATLDLAMVASGSVDAFWEFGLRWWDVAAGRLLVEEAGGRFTAHDGGAVDRDRPSPLVTNGWLHDAMIALLGSVETS